MEQSLSEEKVNNQRREIKCNDIWKTSEVPHVNIIIEGKNLEQVINFKCLDVNLNSDSDQEIQIRARNVSQHKRGFYRKKGDRKKGRDECI